MIEGLDLLTYGELCDVIDYVEGVFMKMPLGRRRSGKNPIVNGFGDIKRIREYAQTSKVLNVLEKFQKLDRDHMTQELAFAKALRRALAPVANRRGGRGQVVVKTVNGHPYLYYRYWATAGDVMRNTRRFANIYLGFSPLAQALIHLPLDEAQELKRRILDVYEAGGVAGVAEFAAEYLESS